MACLCWWYMTEIFGSLVHFSRPFGLTWKPNASVLLASSHNQMAKPSTTTAVLNRCWGVLYCKLTMRGYGLSILASVSLH